MVPHKVFHYFPLTPLLKCLYCCRHTSKEMRWHYTDRLNEEGVLHHPANGKAWKDFECNFLAFANKLRNLRLGLAADGFNPFGNMSLSYSIWSVVLTAYNLPHLLRMKDSYFMLTLLIPGPQAPGKDIVVFLHMLINELKDLGVSGEETRDSVDNSVFTMRAALLWTVNDFPARSSLSV